MDTKITVITDEQSAEALKANKALKNSWLNKEINIGRVNFKIIGYDATKRKHIIMARNTKSGKMRYFTVDVINNALKAKPKTKAKSKA
ncbi:MAG: hypothetical protein KAS32_20760 [Candidatus Peribacteraceae bacterium]|nr:hypothetical protein [Candidatus Peribacteraceae bacterium]